MSNPTPDTALQGAVALTHLGVIAADGEDAAKFLHGQLTNDFLKLPPGEARLAGFCTAKGRLMASFIGWKPAADRVLLVCSADLLPPTLKRLSMFVLRAKARLSDASAALRLVGLAGPAAQTWLGADAPAAPWQVRERDGASVLRLPGAAGVARYLWCAPAQQPSPEVELPALPLPAWQWLEVRSGVPTVVAATVEQFVPQMVNLEVVGGVNFQKGCYPGQEVVARSQYRGTLKRRGFIVHGDVPLAPGQEIFHSADPGQPGGLVANAAPAPDGGWSAFAELKIAATEGGTLHAGAADGPLLRLEPLPYELPAQA
ncbi:YgfZ/GcvT domain-containing protein [Caldimonas tepidiphila]|uniref:CAF17-like 4Fe-4S cluster assembly/insertion protein YgfZ n=1 Tax=Caldimonas tepidiphila TaxID=2315841 RepID=UPI000E5B3EA5|nr:folate-binding protein YgfZ [Caldimonas tepidiphila]